MVQSIIKTIEMGSNIIVFIAFIMLILTLWFDIEWFSNCFIVLWFVIGFFAMLVGICEVLLGFV